MKMKLLTYFCAYRNEKILWLMGDKDDNLDQSHAWSKMAHPENVDFENNHVKFYLFKV